MQQIIACTLAGGSLLALGLLWRQLSKLNRAVYQMEEAPTGPAKSDSPLIGKNLKALFRFPEGMERTPLLVAFTSPTCSSCHRTLEEIAQAQKQQPFPFFTITKSDEGRPDDIEKFFRKYQDELIMVPAKGQYVQDSLKTRNTPLICLVDETGHVLDARANSKQLIKRLREILDAVQTAQS